MPAITLSQAMKAEESPVLRCLFRGSVPRRDGDVSVKREKKTLEDTAQTSSEPVGLGADEPRLKQVLAVRGASSQAAPPIPALEQLPSIAPRPCAVPFSSDKTRYNRFTYKLRIAPAQWKE